MLPWPLGSLRPLGLSEGQEPLPRGLVGPLLEKPGCSCGVTWLQITSGNVLFLEFSDLDSSLLLLFYVFGSNTPQWENLCREDENQETWVPS